MSDVSTARPLSAALLRVLDELGRQCAISNWDGYGATPVLSRTIAHAKRFLEALPAGFQTFEVGAEPDGHVTLEWHRAPQHTLSVSVSPDSELHYAALLGASKAYGTEPFFGEIPESILNLIARVISG